MGRKETLSVAGADGQVIVRLIFPGSQESLRKVLAGRVI